MLFGNSKQAHFIDDRIHIIAFAGSKVKRGAKMYVSVFFSEQTGY